MNTPRQGWLCHSRSSLKLLGRHTQRDVYRANLTRDGNRYHLDGQAVGTITENQQDIAAKQLKAND